MKEKRILPISEELRFCDSRACNCEGYHRVDLSNELVQQRIRRLESKAVISYGCNSCQEFAGSLTSLIEEIYKLREDIKDLESKLSVIDSQRTIERVKRGQQ
jgi:hypothetical protein